MALTTTQIQMRNGTTTQWDTATPTMLAGEIGYNADTRKIKIGDGSNNWSALNYYNDMLDNNYIIDGNFQVAQVNPVVGTEITNPAASIYPVFDLWKYAITADGGTLPTIKLSQQLITTGSVPGSKYCYRININGAGSSYGANTFGFFEQPMEHGTQNLCGLNKKVTLSFWARTSISGTKRLGCYLYQSYGTGGSPSAGEVINGTNFTLTSTWTKFTTTFTTNTLSGKTFGTSNDDALFLNFGHIWGSTRQSWYGASTAETFVGSGDIEIAQVKLEPGDTATSFLPRLYEVELGLCQRYLQGFISDSSEAIIGMGYCYSTTQVHIFYPFKTTMRIAPTLSATAADWKTADGVTEITLSALAQVTAYNSKYSQMIRGTVASGLTQYRTVSINSTASGKAIFFSARF